MRSALLDGTVVRRWHVFDFVQLAANSLWEQLYGSRVGPLQLRFVRQFVCIGKLPERNLYDDRHLHVVHDLRCLRVGSGLRLVSWFRTLQVGHFVGIE